MIEFRATYPNEIPNVDQWMQVIGGGYEMELETKQ